MSRESSQGNRSEPADPGVSIGRNERIAILAWGSLKWRLGDLMIEGTWREDGPVLCLEFSKRSTQGRLTLVIDNLNGVRCRSGWWESGFTNIDDAISNLAARERTHTIGFVDLATGRSSGRDTAAVAIVKAWIAESDLRAAIWTDLSSDFHEKTGRPFSVDNAIEYLHGLAGDERDAALEYIARAPMAVQTPLRQRALAIGLIELRD